MALNEVDPAANRSTANGVTTVFPYTFEIATKNDIEVLVDLTVKTVDVDYTVSGVGDSGGGNITFVAAPANLAIVTRLRKQPAVQSSAYTANEGFPHTRVEADFDKLWMAVQQLREQLHRALLLPKSSALVDQGMDVPVVGSFARGKVGGGIDWATLVSAGSIAVPVPVNQGGTGATTAADARTNLGISALTEVLDTDFRVIDNVDNTKKIAFEVSGISTGTTRIITPPNANLTLPTVAAKGDVAVGTGAGVLSVLTVGANGTLPMARSTATSGLAYVAALNKSIYGFTYSVNGSDPTNDIDFAAGGAMDSTGAYWITGGALTKQLDAAWAVGTNAGMLDTGAVGDNDYYLYVIARSDTGVVDYLASLSSSAPTMPASYDYKRLIGWVKRVGGTNVAWTTYETEGGGLELLWTSPTLDIDLANTLTTARRTDAVKVPLGFSVTAHLNVLLSDATATIAWITCPDQTDLAPAITVAPLRNVGFNTANVVRPGGQLFVRTSSTGRIAARANLTVDDYRVVTIGFTWARRN
jgi:hypothetical protein